MGVQSCSWHAFRRGRATDMLRAGDDLSSILQMGGWRSPAILTYLARDELDRRAAGLDLINNSASEG